MVGLFQSNTVIKRRRETMSSHDKEMKNIATNEESSSSMRGMAMAALVGSAMASSGRANSSRGSRGGADCLSLSKLEFPLTITRLMLDAKVCASGAEARRLIAAGQVDIQGRNITADTVFQSPDELGNWFNHDGKREFFGHWLHVGKHHIVRLDG